MGKKYRLLGLGLLLVGICLVRLIRDLPTERSVLLGFFSGEPFYHGKPLGYWVKQTKFRMDYGPGKVRTDPDESDGTAERGAAWQALVDMGPAGARGMSTLLKDDNVLVRYQTALAMGRMRTEAREQLPDLLDAVAKDLNLARQQQQGTAPLQQRPPAGASPRSQNPAFTGLTVLRELEAIYQIDRNRTPFVVAALLETMFYIDDRLVRDEAWGDLHAIDPEGDANVTGLAMLSSTDLDSGSLQDQIRTLQRLRRAEVRHLLKAEALPSTQTFLETVVRSDDDWTRNLALMDLRRFDPMAELVGKVSLEALAKEKDGARLIAKARGVQRILATEADYQINRQRGAAVSGFMDVLASIQDNWVRGVVWGDLQQVDPDAQEPVTALADKLRKQPGEGVMLAAKVLRFDAMRKTEALLRVRIVSAEKLPDLADALLRGNDSYMQNMAWRYLQAIDPASTALVPVLTRALEDQSPQVRMVAAKALDRIHSSTARPFEVR